MIYEIINLKCIIRPMSRCGGWVAVKLSTHVSFAFSCLKDLPVDCDRPFFFSLCLFTLQDGSRNIEEAHSKKNSCNKFKSEIKISGGDNYAYLEVFPFKGDNFSFCSLYLKTVFLHWCIFSCNLSNISWLREFSNNAHTKCEKKRRK